MKKRVISKPASGVVAEAKTGTSQYRGAVPMKGFVGWICLVILAAGIIGFMAAQLLVSQRLGQLVDETAARVELQGQGRAAVVGEWAKGLAGLGDGVARAEIVRLYVAETGKSSGDEGLSRAMSAQRPYMEQVLAEFVKKNGLSGAHILNPDGQVLLSYGVVAEGMVKDRGVMKDVMESGLGLVRPLRMDKKGVVVDVLRPIVAPSVGNTGPVVGVLWFTQPVGEKLAELVAATPLDRAGERTAMIQNVNGQAMVVGRTALAPLPEAYMDLENRLDGGRVVQESVIDQTPVFATLKPVDGTPLALLQEYTAAKALAIMGLYKPGLYLIVGLLVIMLSALMLALTIHLMAQRNKTRVKLMGQTMEALVRVVEARDPYLSGHHSRVARLAVQVGNSLHMGVGERATLFYASQLAAVGRLLVPRNVLAKKAKLSGGERKDLEDHISQAVSILGDLDFDLPIVPIISQMYEREDGTGHPHGLKAAEIDRMAKVLGACDAFVAMTSERAHRRALTKEAALKVLQGPLFARDVVAAIRKVAD